MATSSRLFPDHSRAASPPPARWSAAPILFWMLAAVMLPLMVWASQDFGATWDEADRHQNGRAVLEYFEGQRTREDAHYGTMYPALFDLIPAWLEKQVGVDRYVLRHRVNAVFGWIGILFAGRLAGRLFGGWAAVLALILTAASPRYFGHSMNNPKDLPFAAMSVVVLYYLSTVSPRWPYVPIGTGLKLAAALGLALSTRPGGLLYFGYLPLLVVALVLVPPIMAGRDRLRSSLAQLDVKAAAQVIGRITVVLLLGLLVGTVFWPWAQASPFTRPFEALSRASAYDWNNTVLFAGVERAATDLPATYLPTWFLISTPPVVLLGMVLSIVAPVRGWGWPRVALWTAALLPIGLIVARDSTVYDGMRHVLFVYPPMTVLAASGWTGLLQFRYNWVRVSAGALLLAGLVNIAMFNVRSYPNQAAYINELAGGPRGAFGRYELDYWGNCVLQAVEWSAETARRADMRVIVWGQPQHLVEYDAKRFPELQLAEDRTDRHHLQIRLLRGSIHEVREMALWHAVHRVTTPDGAVLCTVNPGTDFEELNRRLAASGRPLQ